MRSFLKYFALLVPLTVLLSLPCATKRQIKLSATGHETHLTSNKGERAKLCNSSAFDKVQILNSMKQKGSDTPLVASASTESAVLLFKAIKRNVAFSNFRQQKPTIPLFLLYRKLIIYF